MPNHGVFVPLITPIDDTGAVCRQSVRRLVAYSSATASGYLPCLTSGEGWLLSRDQWEAMVRYTLEVAQSGRVIVGIERPTTGEVMEYARLAKRLGASAVMLTSPFGADVDQRQIFEHYRQVHNDSGLDVYIYNESSLSRNETAFETLLAVADLPRVVGIKDSVSGGRETSQIAALRSRGLAYYIGWEHHLATGLPVDGNVVSLANLEPALCKLGQHSSDPTVHAEIVRLSEAYSLLADDWYRHVKRALKARGVIAWDRTLVRLQEASMSNQKQLYLFNRARLQHPEASSPELLRFEREWIANHVAEIASHDAPSNLAELQVQLARMIEDERRDTPDSARYVAEHMPLDEFRILVQEFAVDGLTEAQAFYYALPRLSLAAQMPMLRIMIDEFGSGNLKRAHTSLYVNLLRELGMPTELAFYVDRIEPACFAFVNLFFWLCIRADDASYFAGAITYLESSIAAFFDCYVQACARLGIQAHAYYTEHQHIDAFHAIEGLNMLRAMQATRTLDPGKAWMGARLASIITGNAFEAAVAKARQYQFAADAPASWIGVSHDAR